LFSMSLPDIFISMLMTFYFNIFSVNFSFWIKIVISQTLALKSKWTLDAETFNCSI
jgi:hypothetical protein